MTAAPPTAATTTAPGLSRGVLWLMAIACGLCAGSNYFNQPLLHSMALALRVPEAQAALLVTLAQVAYGAGLLLLVPLGDMLERRRLIVGLVGLAAAGLFISGFATQYALLAVGTLVTGLFSVAAQVLVPMAAAHAAPGRSGQAVGILMSGLLTGILAARSVAGLLSDLGGWQLVYRVAAVALVVVAVLLWRALPDSRNAERASYLQTLRSMGTLLRGLPRLRSRSLLGALSFASVSALFSTMALLLAGPAYGLSDASIGLVGLVGVAGALMATATGRLADRGYAQWTTAGAALLVLAGWGALWLGAASMAWFLLGVLAVDIGLQGLHISNQNLVYTLAPEARARLNAVYMTAYFAGAAAGSAAGSAAWQAGGWAATCGLGATLALLNLLALGWDQHIARRTAAQPAH